MEYVFNVLVLAPVTSPLSFAIFVVAVLISSGFFRYSGSGFGLYLYVALTALIIVPYLLFVIYVFLMAAPLWTFSEGVAMMALSLLLTPLGVGWLMGMAIGGVRRPAN